MAKQEPGVPMDKAGHRDHSNMPRYNQENTKPKQAKEGSTSGEYSAMGVRDFKGEMMDISNGMYGKSGADHDKSRVAPYMMYNDTTDQNGY
jgi:hypothetical protein